MVIRATQLHPTFNLTLLCTALSPSWQSPDVLLYMWMLFKDFFTLFMKGESWYSILLLFRNMQAVD